MSLVDAGVDIRAFDLRGASDADYAALLAFTNRLKAELQPEDPPTPLDEAVRAWRAIPDMAGFAAWVAWREADVVGRVTVQCPRIDENRTLAQVTLQVLPELRRRGIGRGLLARAAARAREERRDTLFMTTHETVPAGTAFMERVGASRGLEGHTNQLDMARLRRDLVAEWLREGAASGEFELRCWDGAYPESDLAAIGALLEVMNTAPTGNLTIEARRYTPEKLRVIEAGFAARDIVRWTFYVRERASGKFAGFTESFWKPSAPDLLLQGDTGVFPEYRGHGLGRWLKAAMLDRVLRERPQVKRVRTGNADSNAAMLKINHELGFAPHASTVVWQVPLEQVERWLASRAGDRPGA